MSARVIVEVEIGNDAMQTRGDVFYGIRRALSDAYFEEVLAVGDGAPIRDENGNTVGSWRVE